MELQQRDIPPFGLRMPENMKIVLKDKAKKEGRSLNSEIVQRLKRSLEDDQ